MGPGRQNISLWKWGQDHQTLERDDWQLRVDPERAHRCVRDRRLLLLLVKKKISPMPAAIYFFFNLTDLSAR
jgi:hypothetical protein